MSSKHALWQARWQREAHQDVVVHDSGLRVRLLEGQGVAENAPAIVETLVPVHGAHNAAAMVQRLVREGAQLLIDPFARGWRGSKSS